MRFIALLVMLAIVPAFSWGQSLGAVAKKERERREKNKSQGVVSKTFSETEIFGEDEEEADAAESDTEAGAEAEAEDTPARGATPRAGDTLLGVTEGRDDSDAERTERQQSEAEWRSRLAEANARIARAREHVRVLKELHLMPGEYYVDAHGNVMIRSLDELRTRVASAEQELAEAEQALLDLREQARRAGVPPGWLR